MNLCGLQPPGLCHPVVLQELTDVSDGSTVSTFRTEVEKTEEKLTLLSFGCKQQVPPTLLPNYMVLHPIRQEYSYSLPQKLKPHLY
jgi:hypothetical protein